MIKQSSSRSSSIIPPTPPPVHPAPLVSVIIPAYNAELFLSRTIKSVLTQKHQNLEIILVNDGSADKTAEICKKYQNLAKLPSYIKIKFFDRPHCGVSATRNYGLKQVTGDFFCFLDADDQLSPLFISTLLQFALRNQLDYVSSGYIRKVSSTNHSSPHNTDGSTIFYSNSSFLKLLLNLEASYNFCHMKLISSKFKHIHFDESLLVAEDALYNFTLLTNLDRIGVIHKPLYIYNIHPSSTVRTFSSSYVQDYQIALQKIKTYLELNFPEDLKNLQPNLHAFIVSHLFLILVNYCCHPQNPKKITSIRQVTKNPFFYKALYLTPLRFFPAIKALILLCFKLHLYLCLLIIGKLRSRQNLK